MANKKFYYRNKARSAAKNRLEQRQAALNDFTEEQLALTPEELGLSQVACKLLNDNGISTAAALVVRSERDMYKVQGLNKRVLGEIKSALKAKGMALYVEEEPATEDDPQKGQDSSAQKPKQDAQKRDKQDKKQDAQTAKSAEKQPKKGEQQKKREEERGSRFGLADRRDPSHDKAQKQPAKPARQAERITEPLPVELWRKILKGGKWGFSDGFKTVIPPMYDEVFAFKDGLASVEIDGKCGYIDSQNNVVIPLEYDLAMSFSEGLAMVARGEKCGYINAQNEVVIGFEYDAASPFEGGEAKVKRDGKWGTLTKDGSFTWI